MPQRPQRLQRLQRLLRKIRRFLGVKVKRGGLLMEVEDPRSGRVPWLKENIVDILDDMWRVFAYIWKLGVTMLEEQHIILI